MNKTQKAELIYIITNYLYNSKGKIEGQRVKDKWLTKYIIENDWEQYKDILLDKEQFYIFCRDNKLVNEHPGKNQMYNTCLRCNKETRFLDISKGYNRFCDRTCAAKHTANSEKCKQTKLERYGSETYNNKEKSKITCLEKYGTEYYINTEKQKETKKNFSDEKKDDIIKKRKSINLERYGDENYINIEKQKETNLERYGVDWNSKNDETIQKRKDNYYKKTGYISNFQEPEHLELMRTPDNNGLTVYDISALSRLKKDENGLNSFQRVTKVRKEDIDENGLNSFQRVTKVRKEDIDENGLNSYDKSMIKARKTNIESGRWLSDDQISDYELYCRQVLRFQDSEAIDNLPNSDKRGRADLSEDYYHLDHKYSKRQGFEDNIPPWIIGHIANLEFITGPNNCSKGKQCGITKEELLKEFYE